MEKRVVSRSNHAGKKPETIEASLTVMRFRADMISVGGNADCVSINHDEKGKISEVTRSLQITV